MYQGQRDALRFLNTFRAMKGSSPPKSAENELLTAGLPADWNEQPPNNPNDSFTPKK